MSCYAPTTAVRREVKVAFLEDMESFLSSVPSGEKNLIIGDFHAHVGSRERLVGVSEGATWVWSHQ